MNVVIFLFRTFTPILFFIIYIFAVFLLPTVIDRFILENFVNFIATLFKNLLACIFSNVESGPLTNI